MNLELLAEAQKLVGSRLGLDFSGRRGEDLQRKLGQSFRSTGAEDVSASLAGLAAVAPESPELMQLARHLTVGETYFFRDQACFRALEQRVLPSLICARRAVGLLQLRVWSAGCSTGEEPYSLAMLLDRLLPDAADWRLTIMATDINPDSLERARAARYGEWSFRTTPAWARERYFRRIDDGMWELDPRIRELVSFRPLNLAEGSYPAAGTNTTAIDLVLCRNVLMYFTDTARTAAMERLRRSLVPEGWLVVAPPEASAALLAPLAPVNFPGAILFQKRRQSEPAPSAPPEPLPLTRECDRRSASAHLAPTATPIDTDGSLLGRARELANRGELQEARALCERAARRNPLDVEAQLLLAAVSEADGDAGAAREALRRSLYLEPDCALAQFTLGALLFRQGERQRGERLLAAAALTLEALPREAILEHSGGITAGDLLGRVRRWLAGR